MSATLLLGGDPESGARVELESSALTTHGVILGMTGSGKTGLAIVLLEELARSGVPLLICDLKGDMTNLLLNFPEQRPDDFLPWVPGEDDRTAAATAAAQRWRDGLARWQIGPAEMRAARERVDWRLLTPGSGLAPVDLLPALAAPAGYDPDLDPDAARAELDGTTAALLALIGRGGDPLSDRDHVLVASLLDHAWRSGSALDFAGLIRAIAEPPINRLGVLDLDTFYPQRERQQLVLAFNTVLASPSFAVWTRGAPLEIPELIGTADAPRATILYLAHLAERERASLLTLLFSNLLAWTRAQPGTDRLRVLLYLDEVAGILPPSAMPPTKAPLLTLLKQGRAFGTGVVLATQNPVDLDYKALGNIGVKLIGRLDTENDRDRALEGLDLAAAPVAARVPALAPRQFLLAGARAGEPRVLGSRWAMSYLRGPLTLAELKPLLGARPAAPAAARSSSAGDPPLIPGVEQLFAEGTRLRPALLVEGEVVYRKASPSVERRVNGLWIAPVEDDGIAWEQLARADHLTLDAQPPAGAELAAPPAALPALLAQAGKAFVREMDSLAVELLVHRGHRLVEDEGEGRDAFLARCRDAAAPEVERKQELVRNRYASKLRRTDDALERERLELSRDEAEAVARERAKQVTVAAGFGDAVLSGLGALLSGRRRSFAGAARRGVSTMRQMNEKERMAQRARAEVEESHASIARLQAERAQLEAELEAELARVRDEELAAAEAVETVRLTPAAKDIAVRRVALAWVPR